MSYKERLIEGILPLKALYRVSEHTVREKSIRHGHPSMLHMWWARRPQAIPRTAVFASLVTASNNDIDWHDLFAGLGAWENTNKHDSPDLALAKRIIREQHAGIHPKVLDPFMGGGSTGLEALRLGCEAHGVELNPVAYLIELCTLVYPQKYGEKLAEDVAHWANRLHELTRVEYSQYYSDELEAIIWARTATCPNVSCALEVPLANQWWLEKNTRSKVAIKAQIDSSNNRITYQILQDNEIDFDPSSGTVHRGGFTCPACGTKFSIEDLANRELGTVPLVVVFRHADEQQRRYRLIDSRDMEVLEKAQTEYRKQDFGFLEQPIPQGQSSFVSKYNLKEWKDIFTPRQALILNAFATNLVNLHADILSATKDQAYATALVTYLALLIDRLAERNNTLTGWSNIQGRITPIFARQALSMNWLYPEANPFNEQVWSNLVHQSSSVIRNVSSVGSKPATLHQRDATQLPYPDDFFDMVLLDPPYFDAVPYADLSLFYQVWLKKSIGHVYPGLFDDSQEKIEKELSLQGATWRSGSEKDAFETYSQSQIRVFEEVYRVTAQDGIIVLLAMFREQSNWDSVVNNLIAAGFRITATWPFNTEPPSRLGTNVHPPSTVFVVGRKDNKQQTATFKLIRALIRKQTRELFEQYRADSIHESDLFICIAGAALSIYSNYHEIIGPHGEAIAVSDILDIVRDELFDLSIIYSQREAGDE